MDNPKFSEDIKDQAINQYFASEASYRSVARELGIEAHTVMGWVHELGANCRSFEEVASALRPTWGGYLEPDGRSVWVHGAEHTLCLAADAFTQDVPNAYLTSEETAGAWRQVFEGLKGIGYRPKGLIMDDSPALWSAMERVFPFVPAQLCVVHVMRRLRQWLHYEARIPLTISKPFLEACHRLCYVVNRQHLAEVLVWWETQRPAFERDGLAPAVAHFEQTFPNLWTHLDHQGMPRSTNVVEGIIRQLGRKLDDTDGFQTRETAWATIQLLLMRYRFHRFSCSRQSWRNGMSPLSIAKVNTEGLNWVRFARRPPSTP